MTTNALFCVLGLLLVGSVTFAADIPDYPFIFVTGKAEIDTPPNIAECSLNIRAVDKDPGRAESTVEGSLKTVLALLTAKGIAANDIESASISKQILTNNEYNSKEPAVIRGYDLARGVTFKARQLASLPAIEDGVVGSPNVETINCRFDRTDREALEADLLTKALHSARDQSEKIAQPLNRRVTSAVAVSKAPFELIGPAFGFGGRIDFLEARDRMFKKSVSADELLIPSTIRMTISVNVLFKMD